jgi:hypothetical protein
MDIRSGRGSDKRASSTQLRALAAFVHSWETKQKFLQTANQGLPAQDVIVVSYLVMKMPGFQARVLLKNSPKQCAQEIEVSIWILWFNAEPGAIQAGIRWSWIGR